MKNQTKFTISGLIAFLVCFANFELAKYISVQSTYHPNFRFLLELVFGIVIPLTCGMSIGVMASKYGHQDEKTKGEEK